MILARRSRSASAWRAMARIICSGKSTCLTSTIVTFMPHGPVGNKGNDGRSQTGGLAGADDSRHRAPGGGRARASGQDHSRRGRGRRGGESGKGCRDYGAAATGHPAPLPANPGRDRRGEEHNGCVPAADGYTFVIGTGAEETRRLRARRGSLEI